MTSPAPDLDATPAERTQRTALASYVVGYYDAPFFPGMGGPPVPDPHIDALVPDTAITNSGALDVQVNGLGFESTSVVEVDGTSRVTTFVSATVLTARYTPGLAGVRQFSVRNVNGWESNDVPFTVTAIPLVPTVDTLDPSTVVAGSGATTIDVWGANYLASSVVRADGVDLPTTLESAAHLAATFTPPAVAGTVQFSVRNGSTGTVSGDRPLTVTDTTAAADTMPAADGGTKRRRLK